jgi:hypothetical protein
MIDRRYAMQLNRTKLFMLGMMTLFIGIQFLWVDTYVLNKDATQFIQSRVNRADARTAVAARNWLPAATAPPLQRWSPPRRLGWALTSVGGVLVLYTLVIKRSD